MEQNEKLGAFYLGREIDEHSQQETDNVVLYDSKDLTTHAVIIGMTGSGKTGLGIGLLEEAAMDNIPVIAVDPKGDLGNILLTFPKLRAEDFKPWVNPTEAANKGKSLDEYAGDQAELWKNGLQSWGQSGKRIAALRQNVEMNIFTPGSNAGIPVSVLQSFDAPGESVRQDQDLYRERIGATATSLLTLLNLDSDPLTSREHILISNILQHQWDSDSSVDVAGLIGLIQNPPIERIGVMEMDAFFPAKDRFALAMRLNNVLAAPGFDVWMNGAPLDAGRLFHGDSGKPQISVMSIAHLNDSERMFFVTMLLNEILSWMRSQSGTGSLRAVLYMDEVFGYMPPNGNPPSKTLLLTLLKQARAFGLGVVLATQNPVDLDYKGLSNTGSWFIGRLQTERDKARLMEGLEGAASADGFDKQKMEQTLAGLGKRRFLLHNVHEHKPVVFATRWVMSYLSGPFTREQIKTLMSGAAKAVLQQSRDPGAGTPSVGRQTRESTRKPVLGPKIKEYYLPIDSVEENRRLVYFPKLYANASAAYGSVRYGVDHQRELVRLAEFDEGPVTVDWEQAEACTIQPKALKSKLRFPGEYVYPVKAAGMAGNYTKWERQFKNWIRNNQPLQIYRNRTFKLVSAVEEGEADFRARLQLLAREKRDTAAGKLRQKYERRMNTLENRLLRARQKVDTQAAQVSQYKVDTAIAIGKALLGAFLGRKRISSASTGRVGTAISKAGRISKESADVKQAEAQMQAVQQDLDALNRQFEDELAKLETKFNADALELETIQIKAKSTEIKVNLLALVWQPYYQDKGGRLSAV